MGTAAGLSCEGRCGGVTRAVPVCGAAWPHVGEHQRPGLVPVFMGSPCNQTRKARSHWKFEWERWERDIYHVTADTGCQLNDCPGLGSRQSLEAAGNLLQDILLLLSWAFCHPPSYFAHFAPLLLLFTGEATNLSAQSQSCCLPCRGTLQWSWE